MKRIAVISRDYHDFLQYRRENYRMDIEYICIQKETDIREKFDEVKETHRVVQNPVYLRLKNRLKLK